MKIHPLASLLPDMTEDEFQALVQDIKVHGLIEPITIYDDQILDGRHRFKACGKASIRPAFDQYTGNDPLNFVLSKNISRRHMSVADKAFLGDQLAPLANGERRTKLRLETKLTVAEAAARLGISAASITRARKVLDDGSPELIAQVKSGEVPLAHGAKIAELPKDEQANPRKRKAKIKSIHKKKKRDPNKEAPLNSLAWTNANHALRQKWIGDVTVKSIWEAMSDAHREQLITVIEEENKADEQRQAWQQSGRLNS